MTSSLKDKVVLVNGCDPTLGEEIVRQVLKHGALPCVLQRNTATGFAVPVELVNAEACRLAVRYTYERFGRIDAVINDLVYGDGEAGIFYQVSKAALPYLKSCSGTIVNVFSKARVDRSPEMGILLTLHWAEQVGIWGIRVNGVMIGTSMRPILPGVTFVRNPGVPWWRRLMEGWHSEASALAKMAVYMLEEEGMQGTLVEVGYS